jgi:hypothetical protein
MFHWLLRLFLGNPDDFVNGRVRVLRKLLTSHKHTTIRASLVISVALCGAGFMTLAGCAASGPATSPGTPSAPASTPPQIQVANSVNVLAQAVDGAVTAAIAARDQGKCSQADLDAIEAFATELANTGKQIDAELRSTDAWPAQKTKILQTIAWGSLITLKGRISPSSQVLVSSLVVIFNQISSAVGGPGI